MKVTMDVNFSEFEQKCEATISKVGTATLAATEEACEDIIDESLKQVPRDTESLANSAFYNVTGASPKFEGVVGYGGGAINPKSGQSVMSYAVVVHEDLAANHPVGKAKFLEDPLREYAEKYYAEGVKKKVSLILGGK